MNKKEYPTILCLSEKFFQENTHLEEILTKPSRPYMILILEIGSLKFAIPLRSNISHKFCFKTNMTDGKKGLDYTKAVLIKDESYLTNTYKKLSSDEFIKITDNQVKIHEQFSKFVTRYISACEKNDTNLLDKTYKFSTLKNYHEELGIG